MNQTLEAYGRATLKKLLSQCTEPQHGIFIRMYGKPNQASIDQTVDEMDAAKIDWAITQVERTVEKNSRQTP